jgi:hypothetical protein
VRGLAVTLASAETGQQIDSDVFYVGTSVPRTDNAAACVVADLGPFHCFRKIITYTSPDESHITKLYYTASDGTSAFLGYDSDGRTEQVEGEWWDFGDEGCATGIAGSFSTTYSTLNSLTIEASTAVTRIVAPQID